jgi:acetyl-CoA carboxylase biotin carboxyl carrier protein
MTTDDRARGELVPPEPPAPGAAIEELRHAALRLLAGLARPPRSLTLRTDRTEIQLEWPEQPGPRPGPSEADTARPVAAGDEQTYLTADMVGAFYPCPEPGAPPFVAAGDVVAKGQQVGIIEAMKMMIPYEATHAGRVVEVLVAEGAAVAYGDRLFAIDPTDG